MAIEGPLKELGIHDVFQLLDLSRKTGVLRVSSDLRGDEGIVAFDNGRVVRAAIRSKSVPIEIALLSSGRVSQRDIEKARKEQQNGGAGRDIVELLVDTGAISQRELERQLRLQIEQVVFELMAWQEGFFSFEERTRDEIAGDTRITVSTESLLMEAARRIDEWSRIEDVIANLDVVPELAPVDSGRENGAMLDLLPHEWQVLTMIDGERDLRGIAAALGRDEFEIAKIAYGLATTDVVTVREGKPRTAPSLGNVVEPALPLTTVRYVNADLGTARGAVEQLLRLVPTGPVASEARDALSAIARLQQVLEAGMSTAATAGAHR